MTGTRKKRGRARETGTLVGVQFDPMLLAMVDARVVLLRECDGIDVSRATVIRGCVRSALTKKGPAR